MTALVLVLAGLQAAACAAALAAAARVSPLPAAALAGALWGAAAGLVLSRAALDRLGRARVVPGAAAGAGLLGACAAGLLAQSGGLAALAGLDPSALRLVVLALASALLCAPAAATLGVATGALAASAAPESAPPAETSASVPVSWVLAATIGGAALGAAAPLPLAVVVVGALVAGALGWLWWQRSPGAPAGAPASPGAPAPAPAPAPALPASDHVRAALVGLAVSSLAVGASRTVEALTARAWPSAAVFLAAVAPGLLLARARGRSPARAATRAAPAAALALTPLLLGLLPAAVHSGSGAGRVALALAATLPLGAACLLAALAPPAPPAPPATAALAAALAAAALPPLLAERGVPVRVLDISAVVCASALALWASRWRRLRILGPLGLAGLLALVPLRPRLGELSAWRLQAATTGFSADGRHAAVVIADGDLYVGGRRVERRVAGERRPPESFAFAAVPFALRPLARRALLSGAQPGALQILLRTPLDRVDLCEPEPAALQALAWLAPRSASGPLSDRRVRVLAAPPALALARARAAGVRYDLIYGRGPVDPVGLAHARRVLLPEGLLVHALALDELGERALRRALAAFAASYPALLLLSPDDATLLVLASERPLRLDPATQMQALGDARLLGEASRAGLHEFADLLARVLGDRDLARTLGEQRSHSRPGLALGPILGPHAATAVPRAELLAPGADMGVVLTAYAERVLAGVSTGELPGWRAGPALAAADRYLPSATRAWLSARLLRVEGRDEEARAQLEQALRLAPDDVDAARELGRLLLDRGQVDPARVLLARVWARTNAPADRLTLAEALVLDGDPTARLHLDELVRSEARAHFWLGVLDAHEQRVPDAQLELAAYARAAPDDDEVFYELGALAWRQRHFADARAAFQTGARNAARAAALDTRQGARRLEAGDPLGALVFLRRAAARDRLAPAPRRELARALHALGRRAAAQKALDEYLDLVGRASPQARALLEELGRTR